MAELKLDTLESKGLIRLAAVQPELEYLFRHALVQDAAYESLLKQERRALHRLVGDALEELYPDREGELAAVLARHFEQAGETTKAIDYLTAAARFAMERNAIVEAYELYGRAAAMLPAPSETDDDDTRRRRIEVDLGRSRAGFGFLSDDETLALLEPLVPQATELGDLRLEADVHLAIALAREFRGERTETSPPLARSLDRVRAIARELDDPLIAALPQSIVGLFQVFTGNVREGLAALSEAAPLLEQKHDFVGSSFSLVALAIGYARLGEFDKAEEAARRASEVGQRGDLIAKLDALIGHSTVRSIRGDLDGAIPLAMQCTGLAEETGATACVVASNFLLGDAYMRQGRYDVAQVAFERSNEVADAIDQRVFRPSIAAYMRANAASMGDFGPNTRSFDEALDEARMVHDRWAEAQILWKRAETERRKPVRDESQMADDYANAVAAFERMEAAPYRARVLRDWGDALREAGRVEEGDDKMLEALELFDLLGIRRDAEQVRETLGLQAASDVSASPG